MGSLAYSLPVKSLTKLPFPITVETGDCYRFGLSLSSDYFRTVRLYKLFVTQDPNNIAEIAKFLSVVLVA